MHRFPLSLLGTLAVSAAAQGLNPPAPPANTPGIDPRTPINTANTPGRADAFFVIDEPGSYFVVGNLFNATNAARHGIVIEASDVTLDLNGFTLDGQETFTIPLGLDTNDSLTGILATGDVSNLTVCNGTIRDWGERGIDFVAARDITLESVRVEDCDQTGFWMGRNAVVTDCVAARNGGSGFQMQTTRGTFVRCQSLDNGGNGISAGFNATVLNCLADGNETGGIFIASESVVRECIARENGGSGISHSNGGGTLIVHCTSSNNGNDGISVLSGCQVIENVCSDNGRSPSETGSGILLRGGENRVEGNLVRDNEVGIACGADEGNLVINNHAVGNDTPYSLPSAGNQIGPIQDAATATSPFANFEE